MSIPTPQEPFFPPLETERLLLRPITRNDTPFAIQHFLDPIVQRYLLDEPAMETADDAAAIVEFYVTSPAAHYNRWVLVRKADATPIGTCGFHKWDPYHQRAEIGYDLSPAFHRQGYMSEAVHRMLRHGFEWLQLQRIEAMVACENTPSIRLLERVGFQREGLLRSYFYRDGDFYDHLLFSCLRDG